MHALTHTHTHTHTVTFIFSLIKFSVTICTSYKTVALQPALMISIIFSLNTDS